MNVFLFFFFFKLITLFIFGCSGSSCCALVFFSSCGERGLLFVVVRGLLIAVASLVGGTRALGARASVVWHVGSVVVAHGPSCSVACGIFPDQGSNRCLLHWQADS